MKYTVYAKCPKTGKLSLRAWAQPKEEAEKIASDMEYYIPVIIADISLNKRPGADN